MKVQEEILEQLEDMMYNYVQGDDLEDIYQFCRDNPPIAEGTTRAAVKSDSKRPSGKPPAPKAKGFKPGDLLNCKHTSAQFVYLESIGDGFCSVFNLATKQIGGFHETWLSLAKPKQVVLSAPDLMKVLEEDGYQFKQCINGLGWINTKEALPNFFNVEMLHYCGKEPDTANWRWNPRWLK